MTQYYKGISNSKLTYKFNVITSKIPRGLNCNWRSKCNMQNERGNFFFFILERIKNSFKKNFRKNEGNWPKRYQNMLYTIIKTM